MFKKILSLLIVLSMIVIPVQAEGADNILLGFNNNLESDLAKLISKNSSKIKAASSYEGRCARIADGRNGESIGEIEISQQGKNMLIVAQAVKVINSDNAQIKILSDRRSFLNVKFEANQIKAQTKDGYIRLASYKNGEWIHIQLNINFDKGTYEVLLDGIKKGGTLSLPGKAEFADVVQYTASGKTASIYVDDVDISAVTSPAASAATGANNSVRAAYYGTYRARYDSYKVPSENIIPGIEVTGPASASSLGEEYTADAVTDGESSTVWQAAPAATPKDNGKSLILEKTAASESTQSASYTFTPVKGKLVVEEDVLGVDVLAERGIPYVYASNGDMAATMLMSGGNFSIAGTSRVMRDIDADTWYNLKLELDTATDSYNVYINDKLWQQDIPFRTPCDDFAKIQFHHGANYSGKFCIDNLKVYTTSPLGEFQEMIIDEDFETYQENAESVNGWHMVPSEVGTIKVGSYKVESDKKFPQYVTLDLGREVDLEGAYIEFPEGISAKFTVSIARSNGVYIPVIEKTDKFYSGAQRVYFSPVRTIYMRVTITDAVDVQGNTVHAQLAEAKAILKHRTPVENLAFTANVSVSSELESTKMYDARGINDNIVAEFGNIGEWWAGSGEEKWVELTWDTPVTCDQIIIHDSASLSDNTLNGTLTFDDGTSIEVNDIPKTGYPKTIDFSAKTVKKIRFTIGEYEGNANLSELQVFATGDKPQLTTYLEPDEVILLNKDYGSRWCHITDIDNDGEVEYISTKVVNIIGDNHYAGSVCAQEADGTIIWTWGDPKTSTHSLGSDVPSQIADIDNDGNLEMLVSDKTTLYIFNAATGEILQKHPLPVSELYPNDIASDTIILADISGKGYASDIIVKNRYRDAWAYTSDWKLIWHVCMPGEKKVGHYPEPIDIDNDGKDEIFVGFCCVDEDGSLIFDMDQNEYPGRLETGHKDSLEVVNFVLVGDTTGDRIINQKDMDLLQEHLEGKITLTGNAFTAADTDGNGKIEENDKKLLQDKLDGKISSFPNKGIKREDMRFALDPCGGGSNLIMIDGNGRRVWSLDDATHYETIEKADLGLTDHPFELVVTNTSLTQGNMSFEIVDLDGNIIESRYGFMRNRQFNAINWLGEGKPEYLVLPTDNIVIDGHYNVVLKPLMPRRGYDTMGMKSYQTGDKKYTCDIDGDGTTDITIQMEVTEGIYIYVYYNKNGAKVADGLGRGYNISQY